MANFLYHHMVCNFSHKCRNYKELNLDYAHDSNTFRDSHEVNVLLLLLPLWYTFVSILEIFQCLQQASSSQSVFCFFNSHSRDKLFFLHGILTWNYISSKYNVCVCMETYWELSYHCLVEKRLNWVLSFLKCIVNSDGNAWISSVES